MFRFALRNLTSRPVRSLLSLMGLTVAIAGMVGLFSVAEGLNRLLSDTFGRVPGLVALQPGAPIPLFSKLPKAWQQELEAVEGVDVVTAEIWQRVNLIDGNVIMTPPRFLFGTDIPSRLKLKRGIYSSEMVAGRFLTLEDRGTKNTLISQQIADQFEVGVGETMRVNGYDLTIVGIYNCGSLLLDVAIILDIDQVREMTRFEPGSVCGFYVEQKDGVDGEELADRISEKFKDYKLEAWQPSGLETLDPSTFDGWLKQLGRVFTGQPIPASPKKEDNDETKTSPKQDEAARRDLFKVDDTAPIEVRSAVEWASRFERLSGDLNIILTILTSIGLTIAVLSIVNTMLMSVSERMIEFGILKANGWSRRDVMKLIAFESGILGLGGGVLGSLFGWLGTLAVNAAWPLRSQLYASPQLLIFGAFFSIVLGLLGGLYPAIRAMRMMPMDALRRG